MDEETKTVSVKLKNNQKVAIIIGSEGGFSDIECDKIIEKKKNLQRNEKI